MNSAVIGLIINFWKLTIKNFSIIIHPSISCLFGHNTTMQYVCTGFNKQPTD